MTHFHNILLVPFFFLMLLSSCQKEKNYLNATYKGAWYDSEFEYTFQSDGIFIFETAGHYGNTTTKGKYTIIDSIILLHPYTDWDLQQGALMPRLILNKQNTCFYDFRKNYYCINDEDRVAYFTVNRAKIELFEERLLELELVQQALDE